jgi:hypothetical protein
MRTKRNYRGGSAFVGSPWSSQIAQWPGVGYVTGATNHYALNDMKHDPVAYIRSERYSGGRRSKRRKAKGKTRRRRRNYRGGGLLPYDFTNLGNSISYGVSSLYNNALGNSSSGLNANNFPRDPNPLPEVQGKVTYPTL